MIAVPAQLDRILGDLDPDLIPILCDVILHRRVTRVVNFPACVRLASVHEVCPSLPSTLFSFCWSPSIGTCLKQAISFWPVILPKSKKWSSFHLPFESLVK